MSLSSEFNSWHHVRHIELEKEVVFAVLSELFWDRSGLSGQWEGIDEDIKDEIIDTCRDRVLAVFEKRRVCERTIDSQSDASLPIPQQKLGSSTQDSED